jgi:hypothetical protein
MNFDSPVVQCEVLTSYYVVDGKLTNGLLASFIKSTSKIIPYNRFKTILSFFPESLVIPDEYGKLPEEYLQEYNRTDLVELFKKIKKSLTPEQKKEPIKSAKNRVQQLLNFLELEDLMEFKEEHYQNQQNGKIPKELATTFTRMVEDRLKVLKSHQEHDNEFLIRERQQLLMDTERKIAERNATQAERAEKIAQELLREEEKRQKKTPHLKNLPKKPPQEREAERRRQIEQERIIKQNLENQHSKILREERLIQAQQLKEQQILQQAQLMETRKLEDELKKQAKTQADYLKKQKKLEKKQAKLEQQEEARRQALVDSLPPDDLLDLSDLLKPPGFYNVKAEEFKPAYLRFGNTNTQLTKVNHVIKYLKQV